MIQSLLRQHLIDPEVCIRCNTCQEVCPTGAVTHDRRSYAVRFDLCDNCGDCLPPCPTGAIDSWRKVRAPHDIAAQLTWDSLPPDDAPLKDSTALPAVVAEQVEEATAGQGGKARPPWSAAAPFLNLYGPERPALAQVTGTVRLTAPESAVEIRHLVLDFGRTAFPVLEGQSLGIIPRDERGALRPDHVRLYSVASPRGGERPGYNNLALTVKRVTEDHEGRPVRGLCSSYLCALQRGDEVQVVGPYGESFLMPNHPGSSLLMVCTGTGAAPMRAMTEQRRRRGREGRPGAALDGRCEGGTLTLFFGARTSGELPYWGPLMKLPKDLIDVNLAFSREPGQERRYVQDLIRARGERVAALLQDPDCYIYLCGHKRMEEGVREAFRAVCQEAGLSWDALLPELRQQGRYHVETY